MMLVSTTIMVCLHFGRIQIIVAQRVLSHFCSQLSGYSNMLRNINFMREKCAFHTVEYFTIHASVVSLGRFLEARVKIIGYIFYSQGWHRIDLRNNQYGSTRVLYGPKKTEPAHQCDSYCSSDP